MAERTDEIALDPARHDLRDGCVFCDRIRTRQFDYSDNYAVCFQPLNPVVPGHFLVVPRFHVRDFMENPEVSAKAFACASWVATALGYDSANVITSAGEPATQSVFHLHLHVVPRREGDRLHLPWTDQQREPLPDLEAIHGGPRHREQAGECTRCGLPWPCPSK